MSTYVLLAVKHLLHLLESFNLGGPCRRNSGARPSSIVCGENGLHLGWNGPIVKNAVRFNFNLSSRILAGDLNLVLDGACPLQILEKSPVFSLCLLVVLQRIQRAVNANEVSLLNQSHDWLAVNAISCSSLMVEGCRWLFFTFGLKIIHHVTAIPSLNFSRLLMESVRWIDHGMLHVDRGLRSPEIHRISLKSVSIWRWLNCLLPSFQILVTKWLERIPVLHLNLVKVWHWDMSSISWLNHHVWRVTVMLASVIDGRFV